MNYTSNHTGGSSQSQSGAGRSEQLRQRRTQQSARRVSGAAGRAATPTEPRPLRPVTVRNATYGTPVRSRVATTNPRRQFYVALDTPGTELRLPALPRLRFGARLVSALVALACLAGLFSMLFSEVFILSTPTVKGLERLTQAEIEAALDVSNLNAVEVNTADLRDQLLAQFPILESARVSVALPNQLNVSVKERTPLFAWQSGDQTLWADKNGFLFDPAGEPLQLLTISSADQPPLYISPERQQEIALAEEALAEASDSDDKNKAYETALVALNKVKNPGGARQIDRQILATAEKLATLIPEGTSLVYSADRGLGWLDTGGWDVYIGSDLTEFDQKFALYQGSIAELAAQGITPAVISVELLGHPYYRLER